MERKLATWNVNGLAKYAQEVKAFILSQDIDILLVFETHFRYTMILTYHTLDTKLKSSVRDILTKKYLNILAINFMRDIKTTQIKKKTIDNIV